MGLLQTEMHPPDLRPRNYTSNSNSVAGTGRSKELVVADGNNPDNSSSSGIHLVEVHRSTAAMSFTLFAVFILAVGMWVCYRQRYVYRICGRGTAPQTQFGCKIGREGGRKEAEDGMTRHANMLTFTVTTSYN